MYPARMHVHAHQNGWRSRCSVASMAATVACVQLRTGFVREMRGDGGRARGRKAGGAIPVLNVSRHALRSAASSCHRAVSIWNLSMALKMERPYVIDGAPAGRGCGTHDESMRRGKRIPWSMRLTCPVHRSCRRAISMSMDSRPSRCPSSCVER